MRILPIIKNSVLFVHIPSQETGSAASVHVPSIWQCLTAGPTSLKPLWQSKGQAVPTTLEPRVQEGLLITRCPSWRAGHLTTPGAFTGDRYRQGVTICWFWGWRSWLAVKIAWLSFESLFTLFGDCVLTLVQFSLVYWYLSRKKLHKYKQQHADRRWKHYKTTNWISTPTISKTIRQYILKSDETKGVRYKDVLQV